MDKVVLSEQQLNELRTFIASRGFKDELVQNEILDHFASKVEELLAKEPSLPLRDAMVKAHQSFGVLGFYAIQANLEKNTQSRYRKLYRQSIKSVFISIPHMLAVSACWWLIFKSYTWAHVNNYAHIFGENDVAFVIWILILASMVYLAIKFKPGKNYYANIGRQVTWWFTPMIYIIMSRPHTPNGVIAAAIITATITALYIILFIAEYRLLQIASKDYEEYKRTAL